jgi:hypothetical protein
VGQVVGQGEQPQPRRVFISLIHYSAEHLRLYKSSVG